MKRYFIAIRFIFFVGVATILYMHASSVVGSDVAEVQYDTTNAKNMIDMTADESYALWDGVNVLEDAFYVMKPARKYTIASEVVKKARQIAQPYTVLSPFFEQLIQAYKNNDFKQFLKAKEKVMELLRPIWGDARRTTMYEEKEERRKMGWLKRMKYDLTQAMNRLYIYFFPSKVAAKK